MIHTITRQQFIDAVEHGIQNDSRRSNEPDALTEAEKLMLRHVARTAKETARGTFESYMAPDNHMCGCPLTTAGIVLGSDAPRTLSTFWGAFDQYTANLIDSNATYIQIVG